MPYFDNNATTRPSADVVAAMVPFLRERFANPSSAHAAGEDAADALRAARGSVARLLGARPDEIVFTSGGTESNNLALQSAFAARKGRTRIVTAASEHASVLETCAALGARGAELERLPVGRDGRIDGGALERVLDERCAFVSLMLANNETGVLQELAPIARRARANGIVFHADLVQAAGKLPLDVHALGLDLATISAHKIHGPKGAGALWVRRGLELGPLVFGGAQERGLRPGTENLPGIVGFGRAAEEARGFASDPAALAAAAALRERFEAGLLALVPGARVNAATAPRVWNTTNVCFGQVDAEELLLQFSARGLFASAGSACHAQARRPSHVLVAMGLTEAEARACVRFSLSRETTAAEIDLALAIVEATVRELAPARGS